VWYAHKYINADRESIDDLLEECVEVKEELIAIFDACLALKPERIDIIQLYMSSVHPRIR
jgi:hypothetical protein